MIGLVYVSRIFSRVTINITVCASLEMLVPYFVLAINHTAGSASSIQSIIAAVVYTVVHIVQTSKIVRWYGCWLYRGKRPPHHRNLILSINEHTVVLWPVAARRFAHFVFPQQHPI